MAQMTTKTRRHPQPKTQSRPLRLQEGQGAARRSATVWKCTLTSERHSRVTLAEIWEYIADHPGCRKIDIVHLIGTKSESTDGILAIMEAQGYWLSEDEHARLYAFDPNDDLADVRGRK